MKKINKKTAVFILIAVILFIIPFFWLKPGEMDLGGDSNRLYFYDTLSNLKAFAIYSSAPWGVGKIAYNQYFIPYLLFIFFLKLIFSSPTVLIAIFNGLKLSGSFIFVFLIIEELLKKEKRERITLAQFLGATLGALFYTLSPGVVDNMRHALVTHSQVFLNPMIFYFLLRYLTTSSLGYIWFVLLVTLIFSTNFSLQAPPPLFAFYPLAITFLLSYNFFILRKSFPWKGAIIGILFFLGLHAFHFIPVASNIFDKGSEFNARVFENTAKVNIGLEYFNAILPLGKVSNNILLPLENPTISSSLILIPILVILGFLSSHKKNRELFMVSIFFFITLFLVSANITQVGVEFYKKLFLIPGFGMFRNFFGQWQWVYIFFYAILAGLSISYFFSRIKIKYVYLFSFLGIGFLVARSWIVFNGDIVDVTHRFSKNVRITIRMDTHYEQLLSYIKNIKNDGRIFHMPFTDFAYNIVGGKNKGVYIGQSMSSFLAGRNDFAGYQNIDPFSEVFAKLAKEKNYPLIKQMMSLLQIRYVLYNSDEVVSDKFFPTFPYGYVGTPTSHSAMLNFVHNIAEKKIFETGTYSLFEVDKKQYTPHFYAASEIFIYDTNPKYEVEYSRALSFFPNKPLDGKDPRIAFIDREVCKKIFSKDTCNKNYFHADIKDIKISHQRINPIKYKLSIKNAAKPFLLVFQTELNRYWKVYPSRDSKAFEKKIDSYFDGDIIEFMPVNKIIDYQPFETEGVKSLYDKTHIKVNGYANAWYIQPYGLSEKKSEVLVEMTAQKKVYYSAIVSLITLPIFVLWGLTLFFNKKNHA